MASIRCMISIPSTWLLFISADKQVQNKLKALLLLLYLLHGFFFVRRSAFSLVLLSHGVNSDPVRSEETRSRASGVDVPIHIHTQRLISSALIMLLILHLPTDRAIYPVSLSPGRRVMRLMCAGVRSG